MCWFTSRYRFRLGGEERVLNGVVLKIKVAPPNLSCPRVACSPVASCSRRRHWTVPSDVLSEFCPRGTDGSAATWLSSSTHSPFCEIKPDLAIKRLHHQYVITLSNPTLYHSTLHHNKRKQTWFSNTCLNVYITTSLIFVKILLTYFFIGSPVITGSYRMTVM